MKAICGVLTPGERKGPGGCLGLSLWSAASIDEMLRWLLMRCGRCLDEAEAAVGDG
jgi:hypothetical protein